MRARKKSAPFDPIWPRLACLALLATFGPVRPFLTSFCPVWPHLALFDSVWHHWHHLAPFGPDWPYLALLGHSSISISRYFKVPICQGDLTFTRRKRQTYLILCKYLIGIWRMLIGYLKVVRKVSERCFKSLRCWNIKWGQVESG